MKKNKRITVFVEESKHKILKELAFKEGTSMSAIAYKGIEFYLEQLEQKKKEEEKKPPGG